MSFTLTFSPSLATTDPITITTSESINIVFDTADNGATYTFTSSTGTITILDGFYGQTWSANLSTVSNIPSSVTSIGDYAFNSCTSLSSITIPNSVTSIGDGAFQLCTSLTSITIPNSVTSIGNYAFNSCTSLSSITIPSSVTSIGNYVFYSCTSLSSITIPSSVTSIGDYAFQNCSSLSSITIPNSVTSIGVSAFYDCTSLSSITIPNSVISIGNYAFQNCFSLSSITIPSSVTSIGIYVFYSCTSLSSITIPSSVTSIGDYAFNNCSSLSSITIPNSVTSIGDGAFQSIPNLSSTIVTTPITPSPSYAYTWFHTEPGFTDNYSNITFQDPSPPPPIPCFNKDSKIFTNKGYIPIQNLRKGYLIKTLRDGYKPLDMIGYREIENVICKERIKNKLYVCKQSEYQEIFEDLIITGCHAILVDDFKEEQREKTEEVLGNIFVTDNKYRLPACVDVKAKPYEKPGKFTIYHIALENNDYYMNYGIYANGLLVESTSKRYLKELSNMKLIE
jgi:hypothetical protein